jgi:light-regulated signal transduction histidine kinase (bacteriophytochrome)
MEDDRMSARKPPKAKEDLKSFKEEIMHQMHVISENVIDQVKLVAEGVSNVNEKLERFREEIKMDVDNRVGTLALAITTVDDKLDQTRQELRVEIREVSENLNKTRQELKTEIQESRQEILAATKFSYAELDRRLTTLEKEFIDLKVRFEKIESRSAP